jgi:hypothetical protein
MPVARPGPEIARRPRVEKFVNEEMAAPNVLRVPIDLAVTRRVGRFPRSRIGRLKYYSKGPTWRSDIRWYSPRFEHSFHRFRSIFDDLDVARHVEPFVDLAEEVRVFNCFLLVRSKCEEANFHLDWRDANNEAFTLITPLTDNFSGFGMLYKRLDGSIGEYEYKLGEAIIFGDDFVHSTKPGVADEPVVLLCFNFGTDKMEHWPNIARTAARQSLLVRRPDGQFQRLTVGQRVRNVVGPILRKTGLRRPAAARSGY